MSPRPVNWNGTPEERFEARCGAPDERGCINWTGMNNGVGYGQFLADGRRSVNRRVYAHRYAWERVHGTIPVGMVIDHLCRNPSCVNPAHLEVVTMGENTRRGLLPSVIRARAAQQTHCKSGHEFDSINTYIDPDGKRVCRMCKRLSQRRYAERVRNQVAS